MEEAKEWFEKNVLPLESAYLKGVTPWERSGVGLHNPRTGNYWRAVRQPVADAIDKSGSVLDIGCANGYLLESLTHWLRDRSIEIEPFGLDISEALIEEAKQREPNGTFYHSNVWGWKAPRKFDFVITELVYVPREYQQFYLRGLLAEAVEANGKLIVTQYSSDISKAPDLRDHLTSLGLHVDEQFDGEWEGIKKTTVCTIRGNN